MKLATQIFNISHHTLPVLLHYLGKFKSSNLLQIRKNANKMHWFLHASIWCNSFTYLLLTYLLLQFLVSIKYSLKKHTLFMQRGLVLRAPCTLDMRHLTIFQPSKTSSTGPDLWPLSSPDLTLVYCKMWDVTQQRVCRLTLTNWSSIHEHLTWH